jgi:hypothetical protein
MPFPKVFREQHMSGKFIQLHQFQTYMTARETGCPQQQAAQIAGISERSGRRIEAGQHHPYSGEERDWRTRSDPLETVWTNELEPMLVAEPKLEPTTLYEYLIKKYPDQYQKCLRTLQRRVHHWKATRGKPKEVMFPMVHPPGVMGLSDFTQLKNFTVTIGGQEFKHLFYHYRLAYSGWQYVQIVQGGESFISLSQGLQNALSASGGSPQQHRSDSLSAAYKNSGGRKRKQLTKFYEELCSHYRLQPTRNNLGVAHENGSIESPHGYFKRRLEQALRLRGNYDFLSVASYQDFIEEVIDTLNAKCSERFMEEKSHLQSLPKYRYPDYEVISTRVSVNSTIMVRCILYSVPSQLIGERLTIHLYSDSLVGYLNLEKVFTLSRLRSPNNQQRRARCIDYRHLVFSLRRKPRAFLHCQWQQDILPDEQWRSLWQQLRANFEADMAARLVVEALYLAAVHNLQKIVADYLEQQLNLGLLTLSGLQQQFSLPAITPPSLVTKQHSLSIYDQFLPTFSTRDTESATPSVAPFSDASASAIP